jgi:hypothetical protein
MNEQPLDAEVVAALLDGRLSAGDRAAVLALVAADPVWRELLPDAAAVAEEVGHERAVAPSGSVARGTPPPAHAPGVLPFRRRRMAFAALAAAAVVAVVLLRREAGNPPTSVTQDPSTVIALGPGVRVTDSMRDGRWSVMRSGGLSVSSQARSVRLGVLAVDAVSSLREGSGPFTADKSRVLEALDSFDGSAPAAALLRQASDSAGLQMALAAVRSLSDTARFDAGVWLELELLRSAGSRQAFASSGLQRAPWQLRAIARGDTALSADLLSLDGESASAVERTARLRAVLRRLAE